MTVHSSMWAGNTRWPNEHALCALGAYQQGWRRPLHFSFALVFQWWWWWWGASVEKVTRWPRGRPGDFIFLSKGAGSPSFCRALKLEQDPGGQLPCAVCPAHFCAHRALGKDLSDE